MAKITKRSIDTLIAAGQPGMIRDADLTGFCARLNVNGTVSYLVEYRAGRGRGFPVRRMALGRHGALTPEQAREHARSLLAKVVTGADPAADRKARRKDQTVADLLRDTLARHWQPKRKLSTAANFEGMITRTLIPAFGSKRLNELKRSDIRTWHARQTHRPRQANLDLAILRKALSIAVADELLLENPAKGITPHPERVRDRVPTDAELRAILGAITRASIRPAAALLFRLLILTGCRMSEWRTAEWKWIDLKGGLLKLPDAKAGARDVPLSSAAMSWLAAGLSSGRFVIPGDDGGDALTRSNVRDAWAAVCKDAGVTELRVHDLRHAFATRGAALGASAVVLRDALGHRTLSMTSRYISRQTDPVRDLAERIGSAISAIESGGTGDVVPIRRGGSTS